MPRQVQKMAAVVVNTSQLGCIAYQDDILWVCKLTSVGLRGQCGQEKVMVYYEAGGQKWACQTKEDGG